MVVVDGREIADAEGNNFYDNVVGVDQSDEPLVGDFGCMGCR
jgi:hypothetical protein